LLQALEVLDAVKRSTQDIDEVNKPLNIKN
jgi:hypothetical protein